MLSVAGNNTMLDVPEASTLRQNGLVGLLMKASTALFTSSRNSGAKQMRLVETLALGPKKQLLLVSCDGQRFLVGTGTDSVHTIVAIHAATAPGGDEQ